MLLENAEFALYQLQEEMAWRFPELEVLPVLADVRDASRLLEVFQSVKPTVVVFHAAAYKHVPLLEKVNAWQGVLVNVLRHSLGRSCGNGMWCAEICPGFDR